MRAEGRLGLQYIARITHAFLNVFVHPALSRQKIARLDSPFILLCAARISNAHGGSCVRTEDLPCALQTFQSGAGCIKK